MSTPTEANPLTQSVLPGTRERCDKRHRRQPAAPGGILTVTRELACLKQKYATRRPCVGITDPL
jgi:hypothetical protein